MQFDHNPVGNVSAVKLNGDYVRNKNNTIKIFSSEKRAKTFAEKNGGGTVERLQLGEMVVLEPMKVNNNQMMEGCNFLHNMIATGLAKWYVADFNAETEYNVIRHQKLGTKAVIQEGDQDMIVEARMLFSVDCASYSKFMKVE